MTDDFDFWDLESCLEFNPQQGFTYKDIAEVIAVREGEHDGDYYYWLLKLDNEKHVLLVGGCDYTGWDCQSWANSYVHENLLDAIMLCKNDKDFSDYAIVDRNNALQKLWDQVITGKRVATKREPMRERLYGNDIDNE